MKNWSENTFKDIFTKLDFSWTAKAKEAFRKLRAFYEKLTFKLTIQNADKVSYKFEFHQV